MRVTTPPPTLLAHVVMIVRVPPHPPSCSLTTLQPEAPRIHYAHCPYPSPTHSLQSYASPTRSLQSYASPMHSLQSYASPMLQQFDDHNGTTPPPPRIHYAHGPCPSPMHSLQSYVSPTCSLQSFASPTLQQFDNHNGIGRDPHFPQALPLVSRTHSPHSHLTSLIDKLSAIPHHHPYVLRAWWRLDSMAFPPNFSSMPPRQRTTPTLGWIGHGIFSPSYPHLPSYPTKMALTALFWVPYDNCLKTGKKRYLAPSQHLVAPTGTDVATG
jgi:hypothetical protein